MTTQTDRAPSAITARTLAVIEVGGARTHNLKNISLVIPRDKLVAFTGVSGSGKSSLAFDTIAAEGQRRFLECVSAESRGFVELIEPPPVDRLVGLPPTVAIDQKSATASPRSTLGTITEINDFLRLLLARFATPHCPKCGQIIERHAPEQIVNRLLELEEGRKVQILAPLARKRKGAQAEAFALLRKSGLIRARVDGEILEIGDPPPKLAPARVHSVEAIVDRVVIRPGMRPRLAESIDLALSLSGGLILALVDTPEGWAEQRFGVNFACPDCGTVATTIEPRSMSFNTPEGACPACQGLGAEHVLLRDLVIPDRARSWNQDLAPVLGLIAGPARATIMEPIDRFLDRSAIDRASPFAAWDTMAQEMLWSGDASGFVGLKAILEQATADARIDPKALDAYRESAPCAACLGTRLKPEALAMRLAGKSIADLWRMDCLLLATFLNETPLDPAAGPLVAEIKSRLAACESLGLGHLALERGTLTLSGGELQRARLAGQLASSLVGACYILDEPTTGLHPHDTGRLIERLRSLVERGNSVIVVEHDPAVILAADWVVDLGPGAGPDGGRVIASGTPDSLAKTPASVTGPYLAMKPSFPTESPRLATSPGSIEILGAVLHNLKQAQARFPLGALSVVTGVSGSGKSSLIHGLLARAARRMLHQSSHRRSPLGFAGLEAIDRLIEVDQAPIGRGPRSTPATVVGSFTAIRRVFSMTRQAKALGFGAERFSFNAKGGRCEACRGLGVNTVVSRLLPEIVVPCPECNGRRYGDQTLEVRFKDLSIADVLSLRVAEALVVFAAVPAVTRGLETLAEVGLGYLSLGQSSGTLSGGEAQRVKLAAELASTATGSTLLILDEPTTGLHPKDVERLLATLFRIADRGNTVIVVEHNLEVIAAADWVVDLGPGAGARGGEIVFMGTPRELARAPDSATGLALRDSQQDREPLSPRSVKSR